MAAIILEKEGTILTGTLKGRNVMQQDFHLSWSEVRESSGHATDCEMSLYGVLML